MKQEIRDILLWAAYADLVLIFILVGPVLAISLLRKYYDSAVFAAVAAGWLCTAGIFLLLLLEHN